MTRRREEQQRPPKVGTPCFECDSPATHSHHVIPYALGGRRTIPLCAGCHSLVHDANMLHHERLVKAGIKARTAKGLHHGAPPYGWVYAEDGALVEHADQQGVLGVVRSMRAQGLAWRRICAHLNDAGIPSPGGSVWQGGPLARTMRRDEQARARYAG